MPTPHKHAEVIKAFADGETIEYRSDSTFRWKTYVIPPSGTCPGFYSLFEYRVKREPLTLAECYNTVVNALSCIPTTDYPNLFATNFIKLLKENNHV